MNLIKVIEIHQVEGFYQENEVNQEEEFNYCDLLHHVDDFDQCC